jgi:hypothetical protein
MSSKSIGLSCSYGPDNPIHKTREAAIEACKTVLKDMCGIEGNYIIKDSSGYFYRRVFVSVEDK